VGIAPVTGHERPSQNCRLPEAEECHTRSDLARLATGPEAMDCSHPRHEKRERLDENLGALEVQFTTDELLEIDRATSQIQVHGARGTGTEQYL
jgi:hypothetical protein